ncbi:zinc finger, C2H2 type [Necator americanus]|uniref:Zinc finger, C2H2 type n=1 Tax=Necator americanus TaxID=51031 RepID=W2TDN3_NECAM|nr:zinc finger, C2H2 type [Necator americanus]ETN79276.1 zinc finger, C2H2 type [Necator americanus]
MRVDYYSANFCLFFRQANYMAFVSGGGGGLPPQPGVPAPGGSNGPPVAVQAPAATQLAAHQQLSALAGNQHFLDALLQQQLQQQQQAAAQANTQNPSSQLVSHLLATALLGGSNPLAAVNQMASAGSSSTVEPQGMQLLSVLQNQLAFGQLLPQFQGGQNLSTINPLLNPAIALYYQQLLQQQQQQQQSLLQQLAQQQIPQAQAVQVPQAHAFQPPSQASSGSVESQLNAQERLMNAYLNEQQQQAGPFNIPSRDQEQALMNHQVASGTHIPHVQHHHDRTPTATSRNLAGGGSGVDVESVEEKISRLISENEAIVQPHQTLLKRRPYHRQAGGQSSIDHDSNSGGEYGSTRTSPGIRDHRMLQSSSRSQSHYEPLLSAKVAFGGSLTSGLPINRNIKQESLPTCSFCLLTFPNEAGLQVHEIRCSKKVEAANAEAEKLRAEAALAFQTASRTPDTDSHSRHPLKRRLLAAVAAEQHSPTKIPRPESRDIVVIEERKASVIDKKEPIIELDVDHPSLPRRATIAAISLSQQRGHSVAAPIAVSAIPSVMQPVPHAPAPMCALQTGGGSSAFVSPTGSAFVPQPAPANQIPKKEENPFSIEGHVLDGNTEKPYTLVLTQACKVQATTDVATVRRSRGRNITSETFVCMHRAQPMFVEQKGNLSMYSNWHQVNINEAESKLNLLYMGMCSTRPRTGVKPFWRYSVANRDHGQYKMTHSSFWEYRNKVKRQAEQMQNAKEENEDDLQPFLDGLGNDAKPAVDEANDVVSSATIGTGEMAVTESVKEEADATTTKCKQTNEPTKLVKSTKKQEPIIGGYRTDEVYVYVRGRGRGRYVCDRCGIRCKKPSMLNKHIKFVYSSFVENKSHTDIRPYKCKECNFSFKTKGNWTKHLSSKTHRRRLVQGSGNDSDNEDGLVIASPDDDVNEQRFPFDEMDSILDRAASSDDEADDHLPPVQESIENPYRKFGQENILLERVAHTPPSRWVLVDEEVESSWPEAERMRHCSSAPPSAISPTKEEVREEQTTTSLIASIGSTPLPTVMAVPSTSFIGQQPQQQQPPQQQQQQQNFTVHQTPAPVYPYLSKEESMRCNQCDRSFRKASELTLHQYTHDIEKHHARNRMFQIDDSVTASIDPCASTQSVLGGSAPIASNPRSFVCSDCNIGFRKHGILAKHLRSKTHVMKLETLKRLPEDSLSLITKRDNGACLNGVDTTDCEKARKSLYEIVETIRAENQRASMQMAAAAAAGTVKPAIQTANVPDGLDCREQLAASPSPVTIAVKKVVEPVFNGQRSDVEENPQLPRSLTEPVTTTAVVDVNNVPRNRCDPAVRSNSTNPPRRDEVPSIKLVSANVWIPPRAEERPSSSRDSNNIRAVQEVVAELREDNEAERSTCSSPVLRILNSNGHAASPLMPQGTKCQICGVNADSPIELQVHLYSDHISIRDGKDLKCPKRHCDKVYPNKESLRLHIIAHYQQRVDATPEAREDDSVSSVTSALASRLAEDVTDARGSPMSDASDGSWPSPASVEVSRAGTASEMKKAQEEEQMSLPCTLCNKTFNDAVTLQQHWFGHVSSRTHVCQVCDAGFTTSDALAQHSLTHSSAPPTR